MQNEVETADDKEKASHHGSQKRQRNQSVNVGLTPEERRTIEEKADRAGLSLSAFARHCLLGEPGPRAIRRPPIAVQELGKAVAELNKVGSNINQIARALNSGHCVSLPEIQRASEELSITLQAILEAARKA